MPQKTGNGHARPDTEERELPVQLTEAELLERGETMAKAELRIEALKSERSDLTKLIGIEVDSRAKLAHVIDHGTEPRQVRCAWIERFEQNVWELVRQDTGELVDTRPMVAADRQSALGLEFEHDPHAATKYPRNTDEIVDELHERAHSEELDPHSLANGTVTVEEVHRVEKRKLRKRVAGKSRDMTPEVKARRKKRAATTKSKANGKQAHA